MGKASRKAPGRRAELLRRRGALEVRSSTPVDDEAIHGLVQSQLPATLPAYEVARRLLRELPEDAPERKHCVTVVATMHGAVIGAAVAMPFSVPGGAGTSPSCVALRHLVVDVAHRSGGIGQMLLEDVYRRLPSDVASMVAVIPARAVGFYRRAGWEVSPAGAGIAWQDPEQPLMAELPEQSFPHVALKLRDHGSFGFPFPRQSGAPVGDALHELATLLSEGIVRWASLPWLTRVMLEDVLRNDAGVS